MSDDARTAARQLCSAALSRGEPLAWFDELYLAAEGEPAMIPWADLAPNPNLAAWRDASQYDFNGQRCLKIGCGLGDDCEYLQTAGGTVTGFDISAAAIAWCKRRFPESAVHYVHCDLFAAPSEWSRGFEFVLESYTLQVLPPDLRSRAINAIADFVAEDGALLVICRARDALSPAGQMPWPITKPEHLAFSDHGLSLAE